MLLGNKLFEQTVSKYMKDGERGSKTLLEFVKKYENLIINRTPIQDIGSKKTFEEALNDSIDYIAYSNDISSWTEQLFQIVVDKKIRLERIYELEKIKAKQEIDLLDELKDCKTKTEKERLRAERIKEKLFKYDQYLIDVKYDYDSCKLFKNDAERTRELVFAYYQGVKNSSIKY